MVDALIDNFVLKKTTKCERNYSCLSKDNPTSLCEVLAHNNLSKVVKVTPKPGRSCSYHFDLNTFHYCLCPTRVMLFKQYKK